MRYLSRMISLLVLLSLLLLLLRLLHCDVVIVGQDGRKGIVSAMQGLPRALQEAAPRRFREPGLREFARACGAHF